MDDEPIKVEIPITAGLIKDGINTIYNPAEKIIEQNFIKSAFGLSASLPPAYDPRLKPARITPIKLPQVNMELPKTGIISLLAVNSRAIVTVPPTNTKMAIEIKDIFSCLNVKERELMCKSP